MTITQRIRGLAHRLWDELFLLVFVGIPVGAAVAASHYLSDKDGVPRAVLADATRGTLFSALVGLAALLLSVMLAVLTILTTMEERPIVQRFKAAGSNMYRRLVYALLGPVFTSLALATCAVICIALSSGAGSGPASPPAPSDFAVIAVSLTLGLAASSLAQGAYVASLIARMLVFEGRPPILSPRDEPRARPTAERATATEQAVQEPGTERELRTLHA